MRAAGMLFSLAFKLSFKVKLAIIVSIPNIFDKP